MTEPWYLLYGGSSADGRGSGEYVGRTIDVFVAARHYIKISKNPYSTGYVEVITGDEHVQYSSIDGYRPATSALKEAITQQQKENMGIDLVIEELEEAMRPTTTRGNN